MTISETLRSLLLERIEAGETRTSIARECGLSQASISRFLAGDRADISISTAEKLAAYFGLSLQRDPALPVRHAAKDQRRRDT